MERSTTVERSIRLLFELAENPRGLTVTELAGRLGTERPPLYRLLHALGDHKLVRRDRDKRYTLGIGILSLMRAFYEPFLDRARTDLQAAADASDHTALLHLAEEDTLVTALCVSPRTPGVHLTAQIGTPYPHRDGAPWVAVLSARPAAEDDTDTIRLARERGFAESFGRFRAGIGGISVPLTLPHREGCLSLVSSGQERDRDAVVRIAKRAARSISTIAAN